MYNKINKVFIALLVGVFLIGAFSGYVQRRHKRQQNFLNSRTIVYDYDINQDGKLDLSDWSAFGTRLQEQPEYDEKSR